MTEPSAHRAPAAAGRLTTDDVAVVLEVTPAGVRKLVARGDLHPVQPGARPLVFDEVQVWELKHARLRPKQLLRLRQLAREWADLGD